jgi:hypothetical protein
MKGPQQSKKKKERNAAQANGGGGAKWQPHEKRKRKLPLKSERPCAKGWLGGEITNYRNHKAAYDVAHPCREIALTKDKVALLDQADFDWLIFAAKKRGALNGQICSHASTRQELMPHCHSHHVRLVCVACGSHLGWIEKPLNTEKRRFNAMRLARLAMCEGLRSWERGFVESVSRQEKLSPRQQEILDQLSVTYLGRSPAT